MLTLFQDEKILTQSGGGEVTLTSHRICYESKEWGRSYNQNIMLEHITSCENHYNSHIWLAIFSVISFLAAIMFGSNHNSEASSIAVAVALGSAVLYWWTRYNTIIIASPSTKMKINVTGMKREQVLDFINKVEQAKHKRILSLNNLTNSIS